ncbi:MAG: 16S rRNA (guanine(527)-N(7))-methyltransferase RsmG, partial [Polaromonas sp.]
MARIGLAEKDLRAVLLAGVRTLQLDLSDQQVGRLLGYLDLIAKWTTVYNLTAVRDPAEMMTHHLLDSLAVIAPLQRHLRQAGLGQGSHLLDVGSGAGLPGVVIAICCPAVAV